MSGEDSGDGTGQVVDPRNNDGLDRQDLFGLRLVNASAVEQVAESLLSHRDRQQNLRTDPDVLSVVVTPNVDILVSLDRDPSSLAAQVFRNAQYVLPDGMPIVVASRGLGRQLEARLPGSGLFEVLWPRLVTEQRSVVVLCANDEIAERLGENNPAAQFLVPPFIEADNEEQIAVVAKELFELVADHSAEFVLVGLGHPKDALIMARLHGMWREADVNPPLCMGLGGSFAMYIGQKRRAPDWVQRVGLEWFFRFLQEPRRLFHRYFIEDVAYLGIVARERRSLRNPR